jgi:hypothetical protein
MFRPARVIFLATLGFVSFPAIASAGMPAPLTLDEVFINRLSDNAVERLRNISFFVVLFLVAALFVKLIWNYLRKDFTSLPRLSYLRAVGLVFVWGLAFVLVLVMISGARELMTPGAWERDGRTYKLAEPKAPVSLPSGPSDEERRIRLVALYQAFLVYAADNGGRPPASQRDLGIDSELWLGPHPSGARYIYFPPNAVKGRPRPLVVEPEAIGPMRFVLFTDGQIRKLSAEDLEGALVSEGQP